jgi:hypothetical protein
MLLIISPVDFVPALEPLRAHKASTGIPTKIVTLESIYASRRLGDQAEKVKRCIAEYHALSQCRFVLLVGDSDRCPVRFTKTDRAGADAFNTAFYPTDLYYACLFRPDGSFDTWDSNGNGYFGELCGETGTGPINVDGVSLVPSVAVGRVPASTTDEVTRYVSKCITYETSAFQQSWPWHALLVSTHDWQKDASKTHEKLAETCLGLYSTTIVTTRGRGHGADSIASSAIATAINNGVGLIGYMGHGATDALAIPTGYWATWDVVNLTNSAAFPIMLADACSTAEFATLPPYEAYVDINGIAHDGTSHGEHFSTYPPQPAPLQAGHDPDADLATRVTVGTAAGCAAYFGGNTGMQQPEPVTYLIEALATATTLGEAWQRMIVRYYATFNPGVVLTRPDWSAVAQVHQPWKYMLFGDPSLRIRGAKAAEVIEVARLAATFN